MGMVYNLNAVPTDNVGNQPQIADALSGSALEAYFPKVEFSCDMVNNCSGFGTCIGENLCDCLDGRYGDACDTDIPPVEPPVVGFQPTESTEDSSVAISVSVRTADTNPDSKTVVHVRNVPPGASLNHGELVDDGWYVPLEFLPELSLIPPPNFDGPVNLLLIATTTSPIGNATREIPLPLSLQAVADPVTLDIEETCYNLDMTHIPLKVNLVSSDLDGSENVLLIISNVPDNTSITPADSLGDGQYLIQKDDIQFLEIVSTKASLSALSLIVTVRSIETSNGDMWEQTKEVNIEQCLKEQTKDKTGTNMWIIIIAVCCLLFVIVIFIIISICCLRNSHKETPDDEETTNPPPVDDKDNFDNPTYTYVGAPQPGTQLEMSAGYTESTQGVSEPTDTLF